MRTWLLGAVAAVGLGLGATASDASAAPTVPCAPVVVRHMPVNSRACVQNRVHHRQSHRYAHYRHGARRLYGCRR